MTSFCLSGSYGKRRLVNECFCDIAGSLSSVWNGSYSGRVGDALCAALFRVLWRGLCLGQLCVAISDGCGVELDEIS